MNTMQFKDLIWKNEYGGISGKPRAISWEIKDKSGTEVYLDEDTEVEVASTGDGICGPEITLRLTTDKRVLIPEIQSAYPKKEFGKDLYLVILVARFRGCEHPWISGQTGFNAKGPREAVEQAINDFRKQREERFPGVRYNFEFKSAVALNDCSGRAYAIDLDAEGNIQYREEGGAK